MGFRQIRIGQLITPFGPGSIYIDREGNPILIGGLDHWFKEWEPATNKMINCSDMKEFEFYENRLSNLLRVNRFKTPPDYRIALRHHEKPQNSNLHIPALRFPTWYRNTSTSEMRRFKLHSSFISKPETGRWQPIRFISVCRRGHIGEFPWKKWINCECTSENSFSFKDRGGSDLSSIVIECKSCKKQSNLFGALSLKTKNEEGEGVFETKGIHCHGGRPWLGENSSLVSCDEPLFGSLINQTNIYFARTISSISLPDVDIVDNNIKKIIVEIEECQNHIGQAKTSWRDGDHEMAIVILKASLASRKLNYPDELIKSALESIFRETPQPMPGQDNNPSEQESDLVGFRREEFNIIRNELDDPEHFPNLRIIRTKTPDILENWVERVNLVDRLCETRAFYGFDRLDEYPDALREMPDIAMNQLFKNPPSNPVERWLPAIQVFGEGIFLELKETKILEWQRKQKDWLLERINEDFQIRMLEESKILSPLTPVTISWASRYLMVHSLAHILINQLVFSCGYSTASLRERLYVSEDSNAPMAGIMIYTAAGDSEGTLGGLVRLGKPENLGEVFLDALKRASWCSADPVCSESMGGRGSRLINLAACHACTLLPETSCETINNGLDRAMLVGTPDGRNRGFMSDLLDENNIF